MSKIPYNHKAIEKKWRDKWEENPVNVQFDENGKKKENITAWICFHILQVTDFMQVIGEDM